MRQYFRLVYGSSSNVAVFGPDTTAFVPLGEGVKQGDATSSLFFCLGVDVALGLIQHTLATVGIQAEIYMYMDDLTICVEHSQANAAANAAIRAFSTIGLHINEAKSKILCDVGGPFALPQCTHDHEFIVLGANISRTEQSFAGFTEKLLRRQEGYFALLRTVPLHPHAMSTILRICGFPRIMYHCATTPPRAMQRVATYFDAQVKSLVELTIDPSGNTLIPLSMIHDDGGLGAPHYSAHLHEIFGAFRNMAITDDPNPPRLSLTTRTESTTSTAQVDHQWLFFDAQNALTPAQFATALSIRLGVIPHHLRLHSTKCNCGHIYTTDDTESIDHVLTCDMSCHVTHTMRHNMIRDAIVHTTRSYGITSTKEPTCFLYNDGKRHRPDALFHTSPQALVIDVSATSLYPVQEHIERISKEKFDNHKEATRAAGCVFFPFVMATRGTLGASAENFINSISKAVQPFQQKGFSKQMHHAVATAAARGRADALMAAAQRQRW